MLRQATRAVWHIQGMLLWLLQRPYLRYAPFPYPSVQSPEQWRLQSEQMISNRSLAHRHAIRAKQCNAYTAKNLQEAGWLRNRLGLSMAFLEDPMLTGMLAARSNKGSASRLRKAAIEEASITTPRSRGCQSFGWTTRRTTSTERRPSQTGKSPSVGYPREGNGGATETALPSNDQGYARSGFNRFIKFKSTTNGISTDDASEDSWASRKPKQFSSKSWSHISGYSHPDGTARSKVPGHDESGSSTCHDSQPRGSPILQHGRPTDVTRGGSNECRLLRLHGGGVRSSEENSGGEPLKNYVNNPWKIHQELKPGIRIRWRMHSETFVNTIAFPNSSPSGRRIPLMQEIFTTSQRVTSEKRGHAAGPPLSLETNWDFTREADREAAKARVRKEKPYFLVLAFPSGPWSPLMRLMSGGRHFLLENPLTATSWKTPDMIKFLDEHDLWVVGFALGLRQQWIAAQEANSNCDNQCGSL